jgi:hypothetical protein
MLFFTGPREATAITAIKTIMAPRFEQNDDFGAEEK